jgi:hypothetical protein
LLLFSVLAVCSSADKGFAAHSIARTARSCGRGNRGFGVYSAKNRGEHAGRSFRDKNIIAVSVIANRVLMGMPFPLRCACRVQPM